MLTCSICFDTVGSRNLKLETFSCSSCDAWRVYTRDVTKISHGKATHNAQFNT
eukprot:UN17251